MDLTVFISSDTTLSCRTCVSGLITMVFTPTASPQTMLRRADSFFWNVNVTVSCAIYCTNMLPNKCFMI